MNLPGKIKYLINLLESHLQMIDNKLFVKRGGHIPITDKEAEHEDVIYAIRNKWAKLVDEEPTESAVAPAPEVTFAKPAIQGASSIEELLGKEKATVTAEVAKVETKVEEVKTEVTAKAEEVKADAAKIEEGVKEVAKATKAAAKAVKDQASK